MCNGWQQSNLQTFSKVDIVIKCVGRSVPAPLQLHLLKHLEYTVMLNAPLTEGGGHILEKASTVLPGYWLSSMCVEKELIWCMYSAWTGYLVVFRLDQEQVYF